MNRKMASTAKNLIVTHVHPDLDALLGVWILIRFGGLEDYEIAFTPVGKPHPSANAIHVDTGWRQYDHHHLMEFTSSAKLVFESVFRNRPPDEAVEALVHHALITDRYLEEPSNGPTFDITSIIEGLNKLLPNDPREVAERTFIVFDALRESLQSQLEAEREYLNGETFESNYGKAFAIESSSHHVREVAHRHGAVVFVFVDPKTGFRGYKGRSQSGVDFSDLYKRIHALEPAADWFLHASKELLLCGSAKAPDRRLSSLPLHVLVGLISEQGRTS
jgi:hypothetical protein